MKHTKEPWVMRLHEKGIAICDTHGNAIADMHFSFSDEETEYCANRIVDCVNACVGLTDKALKANVVRISIEHMIDENRRILLDPPEKKDMTFMGVKMWDVEL